MRPVSLAEMRVDRVVERILEDMRESQKMRCPYCNCVQSTDTVQEHTSYHGFLDKGEEEVKCEECERKFIVIEWVMREFETKKLEEGEECQKEE